MKVLVTGAGGLIGGYLASYFAQQGEEVIATYRNSRPNFGDGSDDIQCVRLDLSESLSNLDPVDFIIHAAAHTHLIPNSTAEDYIRSNLIGTLNLVEYAKTIRPVLFIYLSTLSMYGQINVPELDEDTLPNGPELYGMTKYLGEHILKDHAGDFPSVSVRLPGVVGPGYFTPWIGNTLKKASRDEDIVVYNPESHFNNIVDLQELGRFVSCAIGSAPRTFEYINLAASKPLPIREVVGNIISLMGSKSRIIEQATDRQSFLVKCDKVRSVFGFDPESTGSIVQRYVNENMSALKCAEGVRR